VCARETNSEQSRDRVLCRHMRAYRDPRVGGGRLHRE
jgi:hypothetical protein